MSFALVKSKGRIVGDGAIFSAKSLRNAIPAAPLLAMLADAALSGKMRRFDAETGEEVELARPLDVEAQLKIAQYLLDKRLPTPRAADPDDGPKVDLKEAPLTPEEIKRLPLSELTRVIEATYEILEDTPNAHNEPVPGSRDRDPSLDASRGGSEVPSGVVGREGGEE